jgi:sortase A
MRPLGSARRTAAAAALAGLGLGVGVAACGSSAAPDVADTVAPTAAPAQAPETTSATTVAVTTPTTVPTTLAPTTTQLTLPTPQPPPDPSAPDPGMELGTIEIPKIGVTHSLWEGVSEATLDRGPGHWPGTALPGQLGNVVIGGHRVSHDRPFRDIDQLVPGDEIALTFGGMRHSYLVTGAQVVMPTDMWVINQSMAHTVTLFACHPPGSTRERYIVFARLAGT